MRAYCALFELILRAYYKSALVPTKKKTISSCPFSLTYLCQTSKAYKDSSSSRANAKNTPDIPL